MNRQVAAPPSTGWARLRRPPGLVEGTRWLFLLFALASVALTLSGPLLAGTRTSLLPMLAATACLVAAWMCRYLTRHSPVALDLAEAVATGALAISCPYPDLVVLFAVGALWFRALYGSTRRVLLSCTFSAAGVAAALPLWGLVPGHESAAVPVTAVLVTLPLMFLTVAAARHLVRSLVAREQARSRDTALAHLRDRLIGVLDRHTIFDGARDCTVAICAATPGLRTLIVVESQEALTVLAHAGDFCQVPDVLPPAVLPVEAPAGAVLPIPIPVADAAPLAAAAGFDGEWIAIPLPEHDGWILLGARTRVPVEAVAVVHSLANQVALALHTSDTHHDHAAQVDIDSLTGLVNRAAMTAALERGLEDPARVLALLYLGLDGFTVVNEGLGHAAGDELLRIVGARLRNALRSEDLCARFGRDEFVILLADSSDDAVAVAQRLVELVSAPVSVNRQIARVGACVGVAFATADLSAGQLLQRADIARYAAKSMGRNRVQVFDLSLLRDLDRATFEIELAAAAGAGQLLVYYQPIVSVTDRRCVAVEALVRWQHPARGLLAPTEFVPTAERTGAIVGIGAFVLRTACAEAAGWSRVHPRIAVHVNVSAVQLTDPGFAETVRGCLAEFDLMPEQLVLEITESMVLDSPAIREALDVLIGAGVAIAIDDFGTGYSALSTLRTLPLHIVKIDKSFLAGGPSHAADEAVLEAIVQVARRLGLMTVAEGVERLDQQELLVRVGADAAQGYLYRRPTPAAEFTTWLMRQPPEPRQTSGTVTPLDPRRRG